jgi:hypothetical protein
MRGHEMRAKKAEIVRSQAGSINESGSLGPKACTGNGRVTRLQTLTLNANLCASGSLWLLFLAIFDHKGTETQRLHRENLTPETFEAKR